MRGSVGRIQGSQGRHELDEHLLEEGGCSAAGCCQKRDGDDEYFRPCIRLHLSFRKYEISLSLYPVDEGCAGEYI